MLESSPNMKRLTSKLGIWLFPTAFTQGARPVVSSPERLVAAIVAAEELGVSELWLGDEGPSGWDPFIVAALGLSRTTRIRIGIGVTNPITRHPSINALMCATLHATAPGRVILGFGTGGSFPLGPFGLQSAKVAQVESAIRLTRSVLDGQSTDLYSAPTPCVSAPQLPIFIGARGPRLNTLASEVADGVLLSGVTPEKLAETIACAHSVRPVAVSILDVAFTDSQQQQATVGATFRELLHALGESYGTAVIGASLIGTDPVQCIDWFASMLDSKS
jgi:alkanesulfonate monooxygenase SsuD/methylene tetrahydromethanopterin reductase-like flavin-dependent oxidoreductase (luciferase family)